MYLVPVLFTFYAECAKIKKKNNSGAKRLNCFNCLSQLHSTNVPHLYFIHRRRDNALVSLLLHRAFRRITLIINQEMHLHKISY